MTVLPLVRRVPKAKEINTVDSTSEVLPALIPILYA